jgi:hypothetical protein
MRVMTGVMLALGVGCWAAAEGALSAGQEAALRRVARGAAAAWPGLEPGQALRLYRNAEAHRINFERHHLPHGLSADVLWSDESPGEVRGYDGLDEGAFWTGHYVAALALKHRARRDGETRRALVAALDKLGTLAKVSGREGYLARYAGPAQDEAYRAYYSVCGGADPRRPGFGRLAFEGKAPLHNLVWLGGASRETYDGVGLGLAACLEYVDDAEVQSRARDLVRIVGRRLVEDGWHVIDGRGGKTPPTALWKLAWLRLMLSADPARFGRHRKEYEALFEETVGSVRALDLRDKQDEEYRLNNLAWARLFVLGSLEKDPDRIKAIRGAARTAWEQARDQLNAQFAAVYLLVSGDDDETAWATLQGGLLDLPGPPRMPRALEEALEAAEPGGGAPAGEALLPRERPVVDFLWQRSPCRTRRGEDAPREYPGIDVFLPYWVGRAAGAIPAPGE